MHKDLAEIMFNESQLQQIVDELGAKITKDYAGKDLLVVGILKGASVFFADLIRRIELPINIEFMMVSSYGNASISSGEVKIKKDIGVDIKDRHVLLVEDIIDSGITMSCLKKLLANREAASVKLCALLSKPARREVAVEIEYLGREIPDEFIVGYGLDYAERYRNLPYIGVLDRAVYEK